MKLDPRFKPELVTSKDSTRYNLSAPWFDADAQRVVATDGHRLVVLPVEEPSGDSRHLTDRELAVLRNDGMEPGDDHQRGKFPGWKEVAKDVVPGGPGTITFGFNARYLLEIAEAIGQDDEHETQVYLTVKIGPKGVNRGAPILVRPARDADLLSGAYGLLMPIRLSDKAEKVSAEELEREEAEVSAARRVARAAELEARRTAALKEAERATAELMELAEPAGEVARG